MRFPCHFDNGRIVLRILGVPFVLRITEVESDDGETVIVGQLESGRYFGPEEISVPLKGGRHLTTVITTMGATSPKGWPMLPEHQSILSLGLQTHVKSSDIAVGEAARGLGFCMPSDENYRVSNGLLGDPCFWSAHYYNLLINRDLDEEADKLIPLFFEHNDEQTNDLYLRHLTCTNLTGPFPLFSKLLPDQSSVEVSYVEGAEFQIRFCVRLSQDRPILMGFRSGHFSLPSFRWAEITQICRSHKLMAGSHSAAECLLLLLPSIYIGREDPVEEIRLELKQAWQELGIVRPSGIDRLTNNIISNLSVGTSLWSLHPEFGWINGCPYSQRNPESMLSFMPEDGWRKIISFFERNSVIP
jgi:hypothetical protein